MRNILLLSMLAFTSSCLVHSHPKTDSRGRKSCPPSYHWDDGECVHNGKHKGHDKQDKQDKHDKHDD